MAATTTASRRILNRLPFFSSPKEAAIELAPKHISRPPKAQRKKLTPEERAVRAELHLERLAKPGKLTIERPGRKIGNSKGMIIYPPPASSLKTCKNPLQTVTDSQIARLDPTGARTRLFAKSNPECARVGDILLVRLRTGDPFAGVCINIRRRGTDTAILLRGQLTRVGVEMWYKVYSPLVEGIEVVERAQKRARRARLTYMRKVKHDRGSVENVVRLYLRQKAALGAGLPGAKGKVKGAADVGSFVKKGAKKEKKAKAQKA